MDPDIHLKKDRARSFDMIAENYERFRPGYPTKLRECIEEKASLKAGSVLLEVGVGPGQATRLFLNRGYKIIGVEPGDRFRQVAWVKLGKPSDLILEAGTFESWEEGKRTFDLVYSGSAFHWVDPAIGYPKAARMLRPGGCLALFWNMFPDQDGPLWTDIADVYQRLEPEMAEKHVKLKFAENVEQRRLQIDHAGLFAKISVDYFPWARDLSTTDYLDLIMTFSDHITLPIPRRNALLTEIGNVINRYGGQIQRRWTTVLYTAYPRS